MKNYHECHVTMKGDKKVIQPLVESLHWKFSCIDGDPVLGDGVKCYATMFYNGLRQDLAIKETIAVADKLKDKGVTVLRRKVEFVIFDDRNLDVACDGSCCSLS